MDRYSTDEDPYASADLLSLLPPANDALSHSSNRNHSIRSRKTITSVDSILHNAEAAVSPANPKIGDIIQLKDGTRKKYNGSSWRRICADVNCSYYTQSKGLCKLHLNLLKHRHSLQDSASKNNHNTQLLTHPPVSNQEESETDGVWRLYENKQRQSAPTISKRTALTHSDVDEQDSLCANHHNDSQTLEEPTSMIVNSHVSRKRRRLKSPPSMIPSQIPVIPNTRTFPSKSNHRLSIAAIPPSVDINNPKKGDIIVMENGSRKKFDGVVWRKTCSISNCFIAAQRDELCRKHFIQLNGKSTNGSFTSTTMIKPSLTNISSVVTLSPDERSETQMSKTLHDVYMNFDDDNNEQDSGDADISNDNHDASNDEDQKDMAIDDSFINTLSTVSQQSLLTDYLTSWLRKQRSHVESHGHEQIESTKQSCVASDRGNTQANLQRQLNLRHSSDNIDDNDRDKLSYETKLYPKSNKFLFSQIHQSSSLLNGLPSRSIGIQCNPPTANQTTSTSTDMSSMTDDDLIADRTIKIMRPSSHILKAINSTKQKSSQELSSNTNTDVYPNQAIVITSTHLRDDQMSRLNEFCAHFHIKSSKIVDKSTTHLITDEDGETLVCPLSKQVIQAVARHMFIITYRWIDACLEKNKLVTEKPFEIQGDLTLSADHHGMQRSRQSILAHNLPACSLFEKFSIMLKCNGCEKMFDNDELIELVKLSGAKHTTDSYFSRLQTDVVRIVLCEKEYLINRKEMYEKCIHIGVLFLTPQWFIESLVQYRIQPFQDYQISP